MDIKYKNKLCKSGNHYLSYQTTNPRKARNNILFVECNFMSTYANVIYVKMVAAKGTAALMLLDCV